VNVSSSAEYLLETHVIVLEISVVDDGGIEHILVLHDRLISLITDHRRLPSVLGVDPSVKIVNDRRKDLLGLLVEVGNSNSGGKDGIIWVLGGQVGSGLGSEVVEFHGRHSLMNTCSDLLGDPESVKGQCQQRT
jgi:hypothetical protein